MKGATIERYCKDYAYVWEDNPRALASGLSPLQTLNHTLIVSACSGIFVLLDI